MMPGHKVEYGYVRNAVWIRYDDGDYSHLSDLRISGRFPEDGDRVRVTTYSDGVREPVLEVIQEEVQR